MFYSTPEERKACGAWLAGLKTGDRVAVEVHDFAGRQYRGHLSSVQSTDLGGAMKPLLKWIGGKTQLLPELLARIPPVFNRYFEPFLGGGALFFALQEAGLLKGKQVFLSDINPDLINCYVQLRDDLEVVLGCLGDHAQSHSEGHYYAVRSWDPASVDNPMTRAAAAARFIYINKAGFNGLWRVNKKGLCNTPWGKHEKFVPDVENLTSCSKALQGVDLVCQSYSLPAVRDDGEGWEEGDFVYFDPPYEPASLTANFTGYSASGFSGTDQLNLAMHIAIAARQGVHVLASNSEAARHYYEPEHATDLKVESVLARRAVNCKGDKRGKVDEILISNRRV